MNGINAFLVGGAVRDMLLGLEPKDSDYVVVGSTIEQMESLGFRQVGADFPVFLHPESGEEYALARCETKTGPGYHGFDTRFTPDVTLEEDLMRRDLTINAMAIGKYGTIVDPYGGQDDLHNKVLKHTSLAFKEDPVRVLRLARFAARYSDFTVHPDTMVMMAEMVADGELDSLTPERVWAEFVKGLMEPKPSRMMNILSDVGGSARILREFFCNRPGRLNALDFAASKEECLEVRFALIAGGFTGSSDFKKWTVNSDCEGVASLVNNNFQSILNYDKLSIEERVQLFNRCDARRRPERFVKVLKSMRYILDHSGASTIFPNQVDLDLVTILQVDGGAIAQTISDKTKIKEAIFQAQCAVLKQLE